MPERHAEKLNNLLHTHSIFRWLDLLNKRTANCLNKRIYSHEASEAGSIVWTTAEFFVWTKEYTPSLLDSRNYCRAVSRNQKI
jgi:hypothetical protein